MRKLIALTLVILSLMALPALAVNGTANQNLMQSGNQTAQGTSANGSNIDQNVDQTANQTAQGNELAANQNLVQRTDQNAIGNNLSQVNQGISQVGDQSASGLNNTTINQSLAQRASQAFFGSPLNNTGTNQTVPQNNTNQTIPGNITNQTGPWNESNYWMMNWTTPLTTQERATIYNRTGLFFANYSSMRQYIMPWSDLSRFVNDSTRRLEVIYIDETAWNRTGRIPGANYVPLATLFTRINQLPIDRPIIIVGDNSMNAAVAMTILRMNGYNAWIAERPASWPPAGLATGGVVPMGTTTAGTTIGGTTSGLSTIGGSTVGVGRPTTTEGVTVGSPNIR